jgi:hypothetical protein
MRAKSLIITFLNVYLIIAVEKTCNNKTTTESRKPLKIQNINK